MKLQYALPVWAETLPGIVPEEVRYCVPYDLTAEGRFLRDGYLAVTRERLFVLEGARRAASSISFTQALGCSL